VKAAAANPCVSVSRPGDDWLPSGIVSGQRRTPGKNVPARRPNILFLCHRVPFPPDKGDRIRSYHLLKFLSGIGNLSLGFLTAEPVPESTADALRKLCERVHSARVGAPKRWVRAGTSLVRGRSATEGLFYSRAMFNKVGEWLSSTEFDSVVCFSSSTLQYVQGRGVDFRLVVDLVDVDSQKWLDYARRSWPPRSTLFRVEAQRVRRIERQASGARAVVLVSESEAEIYHALCPTANVQVVTNGVDLDYFRPRPDADSPTCAFVGYLGYRANVVGLQWFCREVWPGVRARVPQARFRIIGRNAVAAVRRLSHVPGVEVVVGAPDVRPLIAEAGVVLAPLLIARGVQNKVLEAMAMGKTVIASPAALDGLALTVGQHALCADSPNEWIQALVSIWSSPEQRQAIGHYARAYVEEHHNWESCLKPYENLVLAGQNETEGHDGGSRHVSIFSGQPKL
jgi:sugar transferase (PEP-CTERM/EpsH1 system associated)